MSTVASYLESRPIAEVNNITQPKAIELIQVLTSDVLPYAHLVECRVQDPSADIVIVEVEPELNQRRAYPIQPRERLAIEFDRDDRIAPLVFVLRDDFPVVPHLNLMPQEFPRCLCIYEESYRQQKRYWTGAKFIEDIRRWLSLTAKGELHGAEQALEPMILNSPLPITVPSNLLQDSQDGFSKCIISAFFEEGRLYALNVTKADGLIQPWQTGSYLGLILTCPPQQHGIIRRQPSTLKELHDLTELVGFDLISVLADALLGIRQEKNALNYPLVLIVRFPKLRQEGGNVESIDSFAFLFNTTIQEVGEDIGIWELPEGLQNVGLLCPRDLTKNGEHIPILLLNLNFNLSRKRAALLNGFTDKCDLKIVAIGAGALGSQVSANLIRAGFGLWTIVDHDRFLPHNLSRHAAFGAIGYFKAELLADSLNTITPDEPAVSFINADVIDARNQNAKIVESFQSADLILDMSANPTVARYLAYNENSTARRISLFLNPSGTALVCLLEDESRKIKLDQLELQYYRAILQCPELGELLNASGRLRYGQTCSDLSAVIPQDYVALFSAIASRAVYNKSIRPDAGITIWRLISTDLDVTSTCIEPIQMAEIMLGEWRILADSNLLKQVFNNRLNRLPHETGGVLIGSWDMERKIVYVVDMIAAPSDSIERSDLFIRGCNGLVEKVEEIERKTLWELSYVGEWHSHPDGAACGASDDDVTVLNWIKGHMAATGLPGLMMIACQEGKTSWFIGDETAYNINPAQSLGII